MTFYLSSIKKNLLQIAASPWSVGIWIGVPLLVGLLLGSVMGGTGTGGPKAHLLIADQDGTIVSGALTMVLSSKQFGDVLLVEKKAYADGMALLDEGDASAMLVIPPGFQDAFLRSDPSELTLLTNPLQSILPEMAEQITATLVDFGNYAQQALRPELAMIAELDPDDPSDLTEAGRVLLDDISHKFATLMPHLRMPTVTVELVKDTSSIEASFMLLFFPGLLMMTVIFAAQGLAEDLWQEREMGTLRRLRSAPTGLFQFMLARLTSALIVLGVVTVPLTILGFYVLGISVAKLPVSLIWLAIAGLLLMSMASFIQVFVPTRKAAALFTTLVMFPLLLIGGSFFPFENMPGFLADIGRLTPNGMMLEQLKTYLIGTGGLASFAPVLSVALIATAVLVGITTWRLSTQFSQH
jgi:ABC-type multidrug transport system permease subunit